ncbi:MAG: type II toxin-antitoxin system VapC family toxin [Mesorhizobium sp.]|nr:MAG: type II toxin-antitoxin system VapC family toxin [Mesorhizobium sp.]TIX46053.1 MAG: type II toxin-antitoxin system VapC family toxin [Mesorhizobium sp.]TKB43571.1 MAG: type II toxin-antitoxin system VapC family toxin [Mesorhizobium sp.]
MIVLDTHVLVRWVGGEIDLLSEPALRAIERERIGGEILISSISAWEIAMLISRGRLLLSMDVGEWLATVSQLEKLSFISVDNEIAVNSTELPGELHKDPADRIIVATSRKFAAPLVTADQKLRDYRYVKTIW